MQAATLLLNASYEPLEVIHWQRAIRLLWLGRVEVLAEYDSEIRAVSITIKMPSVIRLLRYVRRRTPKVTFNRANILARDGHDANTAAESSGLRI